MLEVYEKSVTELRNEMIELGIKVEQAVDNAWKALEQKDIELANRIYNGDDEIDTMVRDCMKKDLTISMMQGPVAADYRALMATLKILSDLERIADHCADISHYVIHLEKRTIMYLCRQALGKCMASCRLWSVMSSIFIKKKDQLAVPG